MAAAKKTKAAPKRAPAKRAKPAAPKQAHARADGPGPKAVMELRAFALGLPGAVEEFPWGDRALKVNKKVFAFLGAYEGGLAMSVKLAETAAVALALPFASPTRYGLGKAGWVTAQFAPKERPPVALLRAWIEESYRAVAPKKLVAALDAR